MDKNIIEVKNLCKSYGSIKAVSDLSFIVKKGELFSFLGINGAGKSTTINILSGVLAKDSGQVFIDGYDLNSNLDFVKSKIGVVFQESHLDDVLSVYDNLKFKASLYGLHGQKFRKRLLFLSELLELKPLLKRQVGKLSGGQKRRVDIARAIIHNPSILILDEPTTGLDPKTRQIIWKVITDLRIKYNVTVFLTTHYMEEAKESSYVVILDGGTVVASGTPLQLKNQYTSDYVLLYSVKEEDVKKLECRYQIYNNGYKLFVNDTKDITKMIIKYPNIFLDYEVYKGNMDDVFLKVTGKNLNRGNEL